MKISTGLFSFIATFVFVWGYGIGANAQCSSDPIVSNTETKTSITNNSATLGSDLTAIGAGGGCVVTERGISWSTVSTADAQLLGGGSSTKVSEVGSFSTTGAFTRNVTGLPAGTQIFFVAYAINSNGNDITNGDSFYTLANTPTQLTSGEFTLTPITGAQIDLTVTAPNALTIPAYGYIVYRDITPPTIPSFTNGTGYSIAPPFHSIIVGGTTNVSHMGLAEATQYFYTLIPFGYDGTNPETYAYNATSPISKNAYTFSFQPGTEGTSTLTATAGGPTSIGLAFASVDAIAGGPIMNCDGFIVLRRIGADPDVSTLVNGQAPSASPYYVTTTDTDDVSYNNTGLAPATMYHYTIVRYNWNGSVTATYRYRPDELATDTEATQSSSVTLTGLTTGGSNGLATNFIGGNNGLGILGFSLNSANGPFTFDGIVISIDNNPAAKLTNFELFASTNNALGGGDDTSLGTVAPAGAGPYTLTWSGLGQALNQSTTYYYFLVANVDASLAAASPFTISFNQANLTIPNGTVGASSVSRAITANPATATIASLNTPATHGVAASPLIGGATGQAILGFSLTTNGTQNVTLIQGRFDTDPDATFNTYSLVESTDNNFATAGNNTVVPLDAVPTVSGAGPFFLSFDPTTIIALSGTARNFFIVANVDNTVATAASVIQGSLTTADVTVNGITAGSATGIDYATETPTVTIGSLNVPATHGVAASPLIGGNTGQAILGFSFTSNGSQNVSLIQARFDTDPDATFNTYSLVESIDNNFGSAGDNTVVPLFAVPAVSGAGPFFLDFDPTTDITVTTTRNFFIVANVDIGVGTAASVIQGSLTNADVTVAPGIVTGSATGIDYATQALSTAIGSLNVPATHGVAASPLVGGNLNQPVFGFSLTSNGTQTVSLIKVRFDTDPDATFNTYSLVLSTNANADAAGNTVVPLTSATVSGAGPFFLDIDPVTDITVTGTQNYFLFANVDATVVTAPSVIQASLTTADVTINGGLTGSATGIDYATAALTTTIASLNSVGANGVAVSPLVGGNANQPVFGFSLTSNGTQTVSLIKVRFDTDPDATFNTYSLILSTNANADAAGNSVVPLTSATVSGAGPFFLDIDPVTDITVTGTQNYFLVANVDIGVVTAASVVQASLTNVDLTINGNVAGSSTGIDYATEALNATIGSLNSVATNGVAASPLLGGDLNRAIFGFSLTSNGTQTTSLIKIRFDANPDLYFNSYSLVLSTNPNADATGNTVIPLTSATVSGAGPFFLDIDPVTNISFSTTPQNFFLVANVDGSVAAGTSVIQASLTTADVVGPVGLTGSATGIDYDFTGLTATLTQLLGGIAASPLSAGTAGTASQNAILGFSLVSNGNQDVTALTIGFTTNPTGKFASYGLANSPDNSFATPAGQILLGLTTTTPAVTGTGPFYVTLTPVTPIDINTLRNLFVVATIDGGANTTTASIQPSIVSTDVSLDQGDITANSFSGTDYSFIPSQLSTIVLHTAPNTTPNIGFATYNAQQAASGLTWGGAPNSTSLGSLRIRDGGGVTPDSDTQGTTITELTITISNPGDLRTVALFNGATSGSTNIAEQPIGSGTVVFTGISLTAADGADQPFTIRTTFNSSVTDNNTHAITVTAATVSPNGSNLSPTGLSTATTGSANNIVVVATKLIFNPPPFEAPPAPYTFTLIVEATDANNNIDVNVVDQVGINASGGPGAFTGNGLRSPVAGVYTFNTLQITLAGTYNLDAGDDIGGLVLTNAIGTILIKSLGPDITKADLAACRVGPKKIYTALDTLIMGESDPADFAAGANMSFLMILPAGWEFLTPSVVNPTPVFSPPSISFTTTAGQNFTVASFSNFIGSNIAKFTYTVTGIDELDTLTIAGLFVKNVNATAPDSILRSGTSVIEGLDDAVSIGDLTLALTPEVTFTVDETPGNQPLDDPTISEFSITAPPVILNGDIGGATLPDTVVAFSGNGVSYQSYGDPIFGNRYTFSPSSVVPGDIPVTLVYTNPLSGCISDSTRILKVLSLPIQGLQEEFCKNDTIIYALSVNPADLDAGREVYDYVYYDPQFASQSLTLTNNPNPAFSQVIFYQGAVPTGLQSPSPLPITAITINPFGTGFAYDYYCYYTCGYIYAPITNPVPGAYLYVSTSFVRLTIPSHGFLVGEQITINGYLDYIYPYFSFRTFTITQVIDANNVIINLGESFGYPPFFDYGYMEVQLYYSAPYNIPVFARNTYGTNIDIKIAGHGLNNGDRIFLDGFTNFVPDINRKYFTVTAVVDANTVRISTLEHYPSIPTLKGAYIGQSFKISPDAFVPLPGYTFDANQPFPYRGTPRSATAFDEFQPSAFLANWPPSSVEVSYRTWGTACSAVGPGCFPRLELSAAVQLLSPPPVGFTGLAPEYCASDPLVTLTTAFPDDGIYTATPNFGLSDGVPSVSQATFLPSAPGITPDSPIEITYTVTDLNGCTSQNIQYTLVHSLPVADADPGSSGVVDVCKGTAVALGGSPAASNPGPFGPYSFTYTWTPSAGLSFTDIPNPRVDPPVTQNYTLTVKDDFGCIDTDVVTVNAFDPATANAGLPASICSADEVDLNTLGASFSNPPASTAAWSVLGTEGIFKDAAGIPMSAPYTIGTARFYEPHPDNILAGFFFLRLFTDDPAGPCPIGGDDVQITLNPNPPPPATIPQDPVCVGSPLAPALVMQNQAGTNAKWYSDPGLTNVVGLASSSPSGISTSRDTVANFYGTQTPVITGCESAASQVTVIINPNPVVDFTFSNFCLSDFTDFDSSPTTLTYNTLNIPAQSGSMIQWEWDFDDNYSLSGFGSIPANTHQATLSGGIIVDITNGTYDAPQHQYQFTGVRDVTLTVYTDDGCSANITKPIRIGAIPSPIFTFAKFCEDDTTSFNSVSGLPPLSPDVLSYAWDFDDPVSGGNNTSNLAQPDHEFTSLGQYDVSLTITTDLNCMGQFTNDVPIVPYVKDFPYVEDFDLPTHGWGAKAVFSAPSHAGLTSWQWTSPDPGNAVINRDASPSGTGGAWMTYVDSLGSYFNFERSVLYGPCIDVSQLDRPVVTFDYWSNTDGGGSTGPNGGNDGVYMEVAIPDINGNLNWTRFGAIDQGIGWYNKVSILGLTLSGGIGQAVGQFGWSGNTQTNPGQPGWVNAKYSLDDYKSATKLQVRLVFGSNAENPDNIPLEGFAFDNFKLSSRNRQVLVENFTSSSMAVNNTNFVNFKPPLTNSELVKMQYHTSLAGIDPINEENKVDPAARAGFYGITNAATSIPRVYFDGYSAGDFAPIADTVWGVNYFSRRALEDASIKLSVHTVPIVDPVAEPGTIALVDSLFIYQNVTSGKLILHTVLLEKDINGNEYVVRKMLPSAAGKMLTVPMMVAPQAQWVKTGKDTLTLVLVETVKWQIDNPNLGLNDLALVAFVQDQTTREVYQATINLSPNPAHLPTSITGVEDPDFANKIMVYPNPANDEVNVVLPDAVRKNTPMIMVDSYGRDVHKANFEPGERRKQIDTSDLAAGVYIIRIQLNDGSSAWKKVIVAHNR